MVKRTALIAIVAVVILVAGSAAALASMGNNNAMPGATSAAGGNNNNGNNQNSVEAITAKLLSPSIESAPALGDPDAKVTIIEFGDYQCTWCYRWHQGTKDDVMAGFVETGQARFLFKDFPINDHSDRASSLAAEASYCAADQDKYWEYHDELYDNWNGENPIPAWITKDTLKGFAQEVGIADIDKFSECLDSGRYSGIVRDNYDLARTVGLDATPSFIVMADGATPQLLRGAHPYSNFEQAIEKVLSES